MASTTTATAQAIADPDSSVVRLTRKPVKAKKTGAKKEPVKVSICSRTSGS